MRLIDADKAFEVLTEVYHHKTEAQHMALKEALDRVPTIEAEPVKRSRWIFIPTEGIFCEACFHSSALRNHYCANCGAKMENDDGWSPIWGTPKSYSGARMEEEE